MCFPVGHALVGAGVASVIASATGTRGSAKLWIGAALASVLPDLDWIPVLLGVPTHRAHRQATHSLLFLGGLIVLAGWVGKVLSFRVDRKVALIWAAALLSHPLLDVVTTTSSAAASGFGLPLFWPVSSRRWAVPQEILQTPGLRGYRSPGLVARALLRETILLGAMTALLVLAEKLLRLAHESGQGGS